MTDFQASNPNFEAVVRESFGRQTAMTTIGARMTKVVPGGVVIEIPYRPDLTQQNGFMHGGIITAIADSACGYAAYTLMPEGADVLAVEFKINLLAPAAGERFAAHGRVLRPGHTITVSAADVFAHDGDKQTLIASMLATLIRR
ncbi:MAG: PaaI family thioesterase [Anaerolineae bacterium]|nr:PaaI family thioesterase [Anaerolineae bacterium]